MKWKIGNVVLKNQVTLAPMAGITSPAFMKICEEMGASYVVSELISAEAVIRDNEKTFAMLNGIGKLSIPFGIQLFGSNPTSLVEAAKKLVERFKPDIIDINMGCPVPKVAIKSEAGSSLLKHPDLVFEIVKKVSEAVDIPVTVKIRSGWDATSINACEIAKICESAGAKAIFIHGRTRAQGYSGKADWHIIKEVKESVNIPVIGNGDITSCYLAKKMLDETGCDAIMIGRGTLGNPWLIKECVSFLESNKVLPPPTIKDKIAMIKKHYGLLLENKSEIQASLEIRTFILYYLKGLPGSKEIKNKICSTKSSKEIFQILDEYLKDN